ncbi:uncharacterized protein TNCV_19811 [Trichonephila clavipes]|nr:uncharacterized protein TNCV_19811 [Trichonephila clavipes]
MAHHRPRKPASVEYTTDEEDTIVYDMGEDIESPKNGSTVGESKKDIAKYTCITPTKYKKKEKTQNAFTKISNPPYPTHDAHSMDGKSLVLPALNIDKVSEHARVLILSLPNNEMLQKSPFAIHKAIQGISGEPKSVIKLRSGDLLIETSSALQTKSLLLTKTFLDCPLIAAILSTISTASQTDPNLSNIICPPLQCLTPISSKNTLPGTSSSVSTFSTSSSSTQDNLLPSPSGILTTIQSESLLQIPIPTTTTTTSPGNNLNTLVSPLETETRSRTSPAKLNSVLTENLPESLSLMNPIVNILLQLKPNNL